MKSRCSIPKVMANELVRMSIPSALTQQQRRVWWAKRSVDVTLQIDLVGFRPVSRSYTYALRF